MRLKLDENLGNRAIDILQAVGHDVTTVLGQGLASSPDSDIIAICKTEQRCLVTLDLDFRNPLVYKPSAYTGIAVLRLPNRPTPQDLLDAVQTLIGGLAQAEIRSCKEGKCVSIRKNQMPKHDSC